jgi:diacylglycerol O-acyltransferase / wax synthase
MERLSGFDASFLYLESSSAPMHVCSILELDTSTMPGGYTFDRLRDELLIRIKAIPQFRERLFDSVFNVDHPVWVEDKHFDVNRHLHRIAVPTPGGRRELAEICGHIASSVLDRSHPLWEMWVIEGLDGTDAQSGGRVAVMSKIHHACMDGISGAGLMSRLCGLAPDSPPPAPVDGAGDAGVLQVAVAGLVNTAFRPLRLAGLLSRTASTTVDTMRRARGGRTMAAPFTAPPTPFNASISGRRNIAFTELDLDDVKTIKKRFNVTVNDVVMALCSGALREFLLDRGALPKTSLLATVPVSVHDKSDRPGRNQVSVLFSRLETQIADPAERLHAIARSNSVAKEHNSAIGASLLMDWSQFANGFLVGPVMHLYANTRLSRRPIHNLVISNVPGPPIPLYFLGSAITALYPLGPIFHGAGLNITVMSHDGKLDVGIMSCPDLLPDLWDLADEFPMALKELLVAKRHAR